MHDPSHSQTTPDIATLIRPVRGVRIILDTDLANLYGVQTFRLNEAVKRNRARFPEDFLFQLTRGENDSLTSQSAMSKPGRGGRRTMPYAFTEHGALMAANQRNSFRFWNHPPPCPNPKSGFRSAGRNVPAGGIYPDRYYPVG